MLHPIPESTERHRLLEVVNMQTRLMEALCALPAGSQVDRDWLQATWPEISGEWVERFWNNDKGNRANWINTLAAATEEEKNGLLPVLMEQLRFQELYQNPPTVRLTHISWNSSVLESANKLLKSFYDPLFYNKAGYPGAGDGVFHKDLFISGFNPRVKICPYTDNYIQDTKLDHFLPKDQFPMLSCHPDNLIPCSTDANSGSHKGTKVPLDPETEDQAATWFHPRWRSAKGTYRLKFLSDEAGHLMVYFDAMSAQDQPKLDNMDKMFGITEFWAGFIDDEVHGVASDVQGWLQSDNKQVSEESVKDYVLKLSKNTKNRIGQDGLAIVKSFFYEHIANTPILLDQIVRTCMEGT